MHLVSLVWLLTALAPLGSGRAGGSPLPGERATVILVSLDGFRSDYLERPAAARLRALAALGTRAGRLEPVFPSKTFPNHYSLVTGLYPEHHGIVSNTMEDEALGRFSLGDTNAVRDARWWGGEPLWVTAEGQRTRAAAFFWPGSEAAIGGVRPTWWKRFDDDVPHAVRVGTVLEWLRLPPDSAPRFVTLYFSDVDGAGHRFGPDSPQVDSAIARVGRAVGALWDGLQAGGTARPVHLVLVSDHGMAVVSRDRVVFLDDYLDLREVRVVDWSPVAMLVPAAGREEAVYRRLQAAPHLQAYRRKAIPARWHFRAHRRITPLIAVADEGWTLTTRARFQAAPPPVSGGAHGYDNALPSMAGLFVAVGPSFPAGAVVERVRAVDVYALLARILDLRPAPNDGSLDSLPVALRSPAR